MAEGKRIENSEIPKLFILKIWNQLTSGGFVLNGSKSPLKSGAHQDLDSIISMEFTAKIDSSHQCK